jgi:hypothetical protein
LLHTLCVLEESLALPGEQHLRIGVLFLHFRNSGLVSFDRHHVIHQAGLATVRTTSGVPQMGEVVEEWGVRNMESPAKYDVVEARISCNAVGGYQRPVMTMLVTRKLVQ